MLTAIKPVGCNQTCPTFTKINCTNKLYTGLPSILNINRVTVPAAAAVRMERAELNRQGLECAKDAEVSS